MRESKEKGPREKASLFSGPSQRVITVCFEMGAPQFQSQMERKAEGPRAVEILLPSARAWKQGEREREREREKERERERRSKGMGFHSPLKQMDEMWAGGWMSVQQDRWMVPSRSSSQFLGQVQQKGPPEVCL